MNRLIGPSVHRLKLEADYRNGNCENRFVSPLRTDCILLGPQHMIIAESGCQFHLGLNSREYEHTRQCGFEA
jgi:hypothetical protein